MKNLLLAFLFSTVLLTGCTSSVPEKVYQPIDTLGVNSYFVNGKPIGVIVDDSFVIMAMIDPVVIASEGYIRLWLLYGNKMSKDFLLAPLEFVTMSLKGSNNYGNIKPESPTKILADINDEKIISAIITTIGGILQTLSTQNTKIYDEYKKEKLSIGDKDIKNEFILQKTREQLANSVYYYDLFLESVNQGILRRNTLFPYRSINGFIYMPISEGITEKKLKSYLNENVTKFILNFNTPVGVKTMEFVPIKGE